MRVNVYGEELTDRIELVTKDVTDPATDETVTFYGIRFWLKFPNQDWWIHRKIDGEDDDDSSAITIWSWRKEELRDAFERALEALG